MNKAVSVIALVFCLAAAAGAEMRSSVTSNAITWTFDQEYECGQFVNGDWWIQGPATVQAVSPAPAGGRHGSMVDPSTTGQAYDSRVAGYNAGLGVSYPRTLQGGQSLVSTESHATTGCHTDLMGVCVAEAHAYLKRAAVLTCLSAPASPTMFRPPFTGASKPLYDSNRLNRDLLPKLAVVPATPSPSAYARYFRYPWLHQVPDWQGRMVHPTDNQPNYYREAYMVYSEAALLLMLDIADKEQLLINFVQYGIDTHHSTRLNLGDRQTCKWPILFAGIMLGETAMQSSSYGGFREITQTYYGTGWYGGTILWDATPQYEHVHPSQWKNFSTYPQFQDAGGDMGACKLETYRHCCSSHTWPGLALAIWFFPGGKTLYNHNAFFDYVDRWMTEDLTYLRDAAAPVCGASYVSGWTGKTAGSNFANLMWARYRGQVTDIKPGPLPAGAGQSTVRFSLRNHPLSPARGTLGIEYAVTVPQEVRIEIADLRGQTVRRLLDQSVEPGKYSVTWGGTDRTGARVAPGVYMVRFASRRENHWATITLLE
jgi:hypothetical protein